MSTYYVATYGDDGAAGSIGAPWQTISFGVAQLSPGDTLYIRGGTYVESVDGSLAGSGTDWTTGAINVSAYPSETVWIQPTSGAVSIGGVSYHIWTGINIDGINTTGGALQLGQGAHYIRYQDAEIKNAEWSGIVTSMSSGISTYLELLRNRIHDGGLGAAVDAAHGIYFATSSVVAQGVNLHWKVEGNEIYGFTVGDSDSGLQIYGTPGDEDDRLNGITVDGNYIHDNSVGVTLSGFQTAFPTLFKNNIVANNTYTGVQAGAAPVEAAAPRIFNNTIYGNGGWGITIGTFTYSENVLVENNIIANNSDGPIIIDWNGYFPTSYCTITNNLINGNGNGNAIDDNPGLSTISGTITTAPDFVDAGSNDFHLLGTSDAIGAGADLTADVPTDFDGVTRPNPPSIGAFEFVEGEPPPDVGDVIPDGTAAVGNNGNALTTLTLTGKLTAGANRVAVLSVAWSANSVPALSSVTYDGVAMTPAWPERDVAEWNAAAVYILVNPPTGASNVVITWPATADYAVAVVSSYENVDQADPMRDANGAHGAAPTASVTVTTAEGDLIVDAVAGFNSAFTVGAAQTSVFQAESETGSLYFGAQSVQAGVDGGVMSWSQSSGTVYASAAVSLQPAETGTTYTQALTGALTTAGALTKSTSRALAGAVSTSGALIKQARRALAGTLTTAGALAAAKTARLALTSTLTSSGTLVRQTQKVIAGTLSTAGAITRAVARALAGTLTTAGALATVKTALLSISGTLTTAGALAAVRNAVLALTSTLTTAGALSRAVAHALDGTLTTAGALATQTSRALALAGVLTTAGALSAVKTAMLSLAGTLGFSGALARQTLKALDGTLTTAGALATQAQKVLVLTRTLTTAGALARRVSRALAGTVTSTGTLTSVTTLSTDVLVAAVRLIRVPRSKRSIKTEDP